MHEDDLVSALETAFQRDPKLPNERRLMFLEVDPDFIIDLLKLPPDGQSVGNTWVKVVSDPIPDDARVSRCGISERGLVRIMIASDEFKEVPDGAVVPQLSPMYSSELIVEKGPKEHSHV